MSCFKRESEGRILSVREEDLGMEEGHADNTEGHYNAEIDIVFLQVESQLMQAWLTGPARTNATLDV